MTEQQWTIWEPVEQMEDVYDIDQINFNTKGLKIILSERKQEYQTVEISFKNSIIAYTDTDESFILELPGNLKHIHRLLLWTYVIRGILLFWLQMPELMLSLLMSQTLPL